MLQRLMGFVMSMFFSLTILAADLGGLWQTQDDDGKPTGFVRISQQGDIYTGKIEKGLLSDKEEKYCDACKGERKGQRLIGMTILKGVKSKGNDTYAGEEILDPFSGKTYRVKLKLKDAGKRLEVRGYVGVSLFGRTQIWRRAEDGK